jgi:MtrB/PioB family decaheme-associated outer membrane protein
LEQTDAVPYWWSHGEVEAGDRFFLNNPQDHRQTSNAPAAGVKVNGSGTNANNPAVLVPAGVPGVQGNSLAKYYEYSDVKPGPFSNAWLSFGTKNGLYKIDLGGKNIGYNDQAYWLDFSKAGQFYFNFGWDQTPHLYSNSAVTPFVLNGNSLTYNSCVPTAAATSYQAVANLARCATPVDIGIRRDTASGDVRWTPNDDWDIKADYSHMTRKGTQVGANTGGTVATVQVTKPVDDTTQNYGLNAEHVGTSPWGQKLIFKAGYVGSTFTENLAGDFFTIQGSPSLSTGAPPPPQTTTTNLNGARQSVWPSNRADGVTSQVLADLPWKSRYVGNFNYTMMRQNDSFFPNNTDTVTVGRITALPASSLNGAINTLLLNNQVTTKITPELTNKLTYRYYNFRNDTPELFFQNNNTRDYNTGGEYVRSLSIAYTKQNFGEDLNWRPTKALNLGVAYGYERYDWTRADVDGTNENMGKVYGDWKPWTWLTLRASGMYGVRRSQNYDYQGHVGFFQWNCPTPPNTGCDNSELYATTYRQLMIDNRNQGKAQFSVDYVPVHNLTISPLVKYTEMQYGVDATQQGLRDSRKWAAGSDVVYIFNPNTSIMFGYMYEWGSQLMYGINCNESSNTGAQCPGLRTLTNDATTVQTFTTALRWGAIPDKLDTEFRYTASHGVDNLNLFTGTGTTLPGGGQFPQNRTWFQRFDATATYKFDKQQVASLGWRGDIKAKLHYTWERNSVDNWANDPLTAMTNLSGMSNTLWLGWNNPNYNVHMLKAALVASW